jgi:hypothetical protein
MAESNKDLTRRIFLGGAVALPALVVIARSAAVADTNKASKDAVHYQNSPNGDKQCSGCKYFIAGSDPNAAGTCQLVDGSISPHGYCDSFSAKS